jgi:hypothetical protein
VLSIEVGFQGFIPCPYFIILPADFLHLFLEEYDSFCYSLQDLSISSAVAAAPNALRAMA